jgi:hypothetical protein
VAGQTLITSNAGISVKNLFSLSVLMITVKTDLNFEKKTAEVVWAYLVSILKIPSSLGQKERRFCAKHFVRCKEMTEMGSGLSSY